MSLFTLEDFQWSFNPQQSLNVSNKKFWSKALKLRDVKAWTIHLEELFYWTGNFFVWNVNFNMPLIEPKGQFHSLRKACWEREHWFCPLGSWNDITGKNNNNNNKNVILNKPAIWISIMGTVQSKYLIMQELVVAIQNLSIWWWYSLVH